MLVETIASAWVEGYHWCDPDYATASVFRAFGISKFFDPAWYFEGNAKHPMAVGLHDVVNYRPFSLLHESVLKAGRRLGNGNDWVALSSGVNGKNATKCMQR